MSIIAALVSILANLWSIATGMRRKDAVTQVAEEANRGARTDAQTSRQGSTELNKEQTRVQDQTAAARADVRTSTSMRDARAAAEARIDRANGDVP